MSINDLARASKANRALVKELIGELQAHYKDHGFRLDEVAGGFAFRTSAAFAPFVRDMSLKKPVRMSRAQIETLAIVAYRQPITRPEIDDVRGVDSGPVLKALLERDLVRILGKKDEPGRPMLYGTTAQFLEFFGLRALSDLPTLREFTELSDESRRTYERELGEEPPEETTQTSPATEKPIVDQPMGDGLAGSEGALRARFAEGEAELDVAEGEAGLEVAEGEAEPELAEGEAGAEDAVAEDEVTEDEEVGEETTRSSSQGRPDVEDNKVEDNEVGVDEGEVEGDDEDDDEDDDDDDDDEDEDDEDEDEEDDDE
jgi:segregation and condensation protein B